MDAHDSRFFRAIALGACIGIPVLWALMTVAFLLVTDQSARDIIGFSALPAVFCGPFLGGVLTTAAVGQPDEARTADEVAAPERQTLRHAA